MFGLFAVLVGCTSDDAAMGGTSSEGTSAADTSGEGSTGTSTGAASMPMTGTTTTVMPMSSEASTSPTDASDDSGQPIPDDCIDDPSPGDHVFSCSDLTFDVTIPEQCADTACGLVFDVHGYTMSGVMEDANTNMRALGRERGYIIVQPNATPAPPAASWSPAIDDDKIFDFMMRAIEVLGVDENRVHFTGFSQGGWMSWRFICAHSDVLASVAPGAACGDTECDFVDTIPERPLPILYMHGTDDALVNYSCAEPRRDAVVAAFGLGAEIVVEEGMGYRWTRYDGDAPLEFISHDYVAPDNPILRGHCFPGSDDPGGATGQLFTFRCDGENGFTWGEAVMDFFEAHPKQ